MSAFGLLGLFLLARHEYHHQHKQQYHRHRHDRRHDDGLDLHRIRRDSNAAVVHVLDPVAANQKAVGVDAVRRAGDQRTQVLALLDQQRLGVLRLDDQDLVDLIGEGLVKHADHEDVACDELVEVGKQLCRGQAAVTRDDTVAALAAYGQARPFEVADGDLKDVLLGAVVYGERDLDVRDLDIAHYAGAVDVQELIVSHLLLVREQIAVGAPYEAGVILLRLREDALIQLGVHVRDLIRIVGDGARRCERVPVIAYRGIKQQGQTYKEYDHQYGVVDLAFHILEVSPCRYHPGRSPSPV